MNNVCADIQCPFNKSSGCSRYNSAWLCHLRVNHPDLFSRPNEYWLFAHLDEEAIAILKQENDNYITQDESSQLQLARAK